MTTGLIINRGTSRKPDYWLLSIDDFTDDELTEVASAMKKNKIQSWPDGVSVRWGKLYSKEQVLAALRQQLPAKRVAHTPQPHTPRPPPRGGFLFPSPVEPEPYPVHEQPARHQRHE